MNLDMLTKVLNNP